VESLPKNVVKKTTRVEEGASMTDRSHGESVQIIGEQRLHPALRKLGRACIALVRWQREQQQRLAEPVTEAPVVPEQECGHD